MQNSDNAYSRAGHSFPVKTVLLTIAAYILLGAFPCCGGDGPLFVQVHYSSPLTDIDGRRLGELLAGRASDLHAHGGTSPIPVLYCDAVIYKEFTAAYPGVRCRKADLRSDGALPSARNALIFSDLRGLSPCYRALPIDGVYPWGIVREDYTLDPPGDYPFSLPGAEPWKRDGYLHMVQTGVTAMTRAFIPAVDRSRDPDYPIRHTRGITSRADLAVTSNEVSFLDPCTYPLRDRMVFCAPLRFFGILERSGFDVIELTGNHNNDFGRVHNLRTMEMIHRAGMVYFGGGRDLADALMVRYVRIRGVRFAFVGFNETGPPTAWALENGPGAARLNDKLLMQKIREASAQADIVLVSIQCANENDPAPWRRQRLLFQRAADAGAHIIVSSSAHRAMGLEFYRGKFISYGLGNFLFDQMQTVNHRRGLIARHHFYHGRHIQTELIPYLIYEHCQPRPVRGSGAREIFDYVFRHSLGGVFRGP